VTAEGGVSSTWDEEVDVAGVYTVDDDVDAEVVQDPGDEILVGLKSMVRESRD
jgi:hypothetical protein